jgi:hypothetical protein
VQPKHVVMNDKLMKRVYVYTHSTSCKQGLSVNILLKSVNNRPSNTFLARVISSTLKMEATRFSETSVCNKPTWRHIPEDGILYFTNTVLVQYGRSSQIFILLLQSLSELCITGVFVFCFIVGACSNIDGLGTMLQAGRSWV